MPINVCTGMDNVEYLIFEGQCWWWLWSEPHDWLAWEHERDGEVHYRVSNIRNRDWWWTSTCNSSTYDWYCLVYHSTYFSVHLLPTSRFDIIFYPSIMRVHSIDITTRKRLIIIWKYEKGEDKSDLIWYDI